MNYDEEYSVKCQWKHGKADVAIESVALQVEKPKLNTETKAESNWGFENEVTQCEVDYLKRIKMKLKIEELKNATWARFSERS